MEQNPIHFLEIKCDRAEISEEERRKWFEENTAIYRPAYGSYSNADSPYKFTIVDSPDKSD